MIEMTPELFRQHPKVREAAANCLVWLEKEPTDKAIDDLITELRTWSYPSTESGDLEPS